MPHTINAELTLEAKSPTPNFAIIARMTRRDGEEFFFTGYDSSLVVGGNTYTPQDGLSVSAIAQTTGSDPSNGNVVGFFSDERITDDDMRRGLYNGAQILFSVVNHQRPQDGSWPYLLVELGTIKIDGNQYQIEMTTLLQRAAQEIGYKTMSTCPYRFGDPDTCTFDIATVTFTRTVTDINETVAGSAEVKEYQINCGGGAVSPFDEDDFYTGGETRTVSDDIDMDFATDDPAPENVYKTRRTGDFLYTFPSLTPKQNYQVRMHFAETDDGTTRPGIRIMNIFLNGLAAFIGYDIFARAHGGFRARIEEKSTRANDDGEIIVDFDKDVGNATVNGLEIVKPAIAGIDGDGVRFGSDTALSGSYSQGVIRWLTGVNAGSNYDIKQHINDGGDAVITPTNPWFRPPQVGDTAELIFGCDKSFDMCKLVFLNWLNFGGFERLPGNEMVFRMNR